MVSAQGLAPLSLTMATKPFVRIFLLAALLCSGAFGLSYQPAEARCYTTYEQALEDLDESRWEKAEEKLKKVLAENPNSADAHAEMGRLYMNKDDFPQMAAELNRAIELRQQIVQGLRKSRLL